MIITLIMTAIAGYLLGSINSALIVSRLTNREDIRSRGSGNAGATNMFRNYGKLAGLATVAGDLLKAILAVLLGRAVFSLTGQKIAFDPGLITGLFVLIGHIYPAFFRFKGGKGVMPAVGIVLMADLWAAAILLTIAITVFLITRTMSLVSLICAAALPLVILSLGLLRGNDPLGPVLLTLAYAVLVFYAHRSNITRLRNGTEKKITP
jgi:acyl phosphate:glycerol-3-phosphate acyltransferase